MKVVLNFKCALGKGGRLRLSSHGPSKVHFDISDVLSAVTKIIECFFLDELKISSFEYHMV